jgi:glutamate racemase
LPKTIKKLNKIGIFDSGLGGLVIAKAIFSGPPKADGPASGGKNLSAYDYVYLGDTKHLPYGDKSANEVYEFTRDAVKFLFDQGCTLVILACNTASALALRKIQQGFLPKYYPDRRVLGVVIPTLEAVTRMTLVKSSIGVLATASTTKSHIYKKELQKINSKIKIHEQSAPELVPMIENNKIEGITPILKGYLRPFIKREISALILGCTHYPLIKRQIGQILGKNVKIICQTDIIPLKLKDYLARHPEIDSKLNKSSRRQFLVTKFSKHFNTVAKRLFGREIKFKVV